MCQYKAIALDIDGTLLNTKKEITPGVFQQIRRLQNKEIPVIIASGRPEEGIRHVAKALNMDEYGGYILSFNGGKITEFKSDEIVYNNQVPVEYNAEIIRFAEKIPGATILTYENGRIITENPHSEYVQLESRVVKMPVEKIDSLIERVVFPVNKFLIVGAPELLKTHVKQMAEEFKGRLNIFQSEPFFIEVVPLHIDKAKSLDYLLTTLKLTKEQLIACGDGGNDVTMIDYAGLGVAMKNACEEVKEVADYETDSCDQDGVAKVIEKFFK